MPAEIKNFELSLSKMKRMISDFHSEMLRGLNRKKSSLEMLPAYVDKPKGIESGKFIALDLGGTNFRILQLELKGKGKISILGERKFILQKRHIRGSGRELFDFIAGCIKKFIREKNIAKQEKHDLGFTFSFPIEQRAIASGILLYWTKDFSARGVVGKDVVRLLNDALARKQLNNITVAALANDTVGTLVARGYKDRHCDIGVILGTGTNACYRERISNIHRCKDCKTETGQMLVNIEWGNFNKLESTIYDKLLDKNSDNPGQHILEKMVSGMYLGELARIIINDLIKRNIVPKNFKTEYMSQIENDRTANLSGINRLLKKLGITKSNLEDRLLVKRICELVSKRAARISAVALAGVITKIDPCLSRKHTVAVDGTVYEKYPGFSKNIKFTLGQILGRKSCKIKLVLTKDGSGIGAAIIAAVASRRSYA